MYTRVSNVWASNAKNEAEAKALTLKAQLMLVLRELIFKNGWNQAEAAKKLGISQPRVSYLTNGQVSKFSMDKLYELLTLCGYDLEVSLQDGIPAVTTTPNKAA
ncbi:helix-turn-helix domain-containing protein [Alloalcanivorax mobilis]|uniref:helix-turn-helix domain-containing protein n=1 Tax=Alloalcanivorax mobilis TaxID=2019569 RepID=UPI000B5B26D3|nr:helix-turn-helix transcriptional regulator [Alloalcanivorax mobilis]ASK33539.1 transcriptional regulator [Alcanivorax sp. N3-2A]|tara:strand:+ start:931 stop:1242 length:312 start_codon:yes stop_codon:yes gene_type:complete